MGKSLDDIFREKLKGQDQLPQGIGFNPERIKEMVDMQMQKPKRRRKWFTAVLLLLLFGSSGLNIIQYNLRSDQNAGIEQSQNDDFPAVNESLVLNDVNNSAEVEIKESDSSKEILRLDYIPQMIPTKEVRFEIVHHIHPIQKVEVVTQRSIVEESIKDEIQKEETSDLPVFYESDELALKIESNPDRNRSKNRNSYKQLN